MRLLHSAMTVALLVSGANAAAQSTRPPRDFAEFRGTWVLDESRTVGRIAALPAAKRVVISTTPTEFTVVKDSQEPEIFRVDGSEVQLRDERTGALLDRTRRFTLVAGMVALTTAEKRPVAGGPAAAFTGTRTNNMIVTDAYMVLGDELIVERQMSSLALPEGHLVMLGDPRNNAMTMVYGRETPRR